MFFELFQSYTISYIYSMQDGKRKKRRYIRNFAIFYWKTSASRFLWSDNNLCNAWYVCCIGNSCPLFEGILKKIDSLICKTNARLTFLVSARHLLIIYQLSLHQPQWSYLWGEGGTFSSLCIFPDRYWSRPVYYVHIAYCLTGILWKRHAWFFARCFFVKDKMTETSVYTSVYRRVNRGLFFYVSFGWEGACSCIIYIARNRHTNWRKTKQGRAGHRSIRLTLICSALARSKATWRKQRRRRLL